MDGGYHMLSILTAFSWQFGNLETLESRNTKFDVQGLGNWKFRLWDLKIGRLEN